VEDLAQWARNFDTGRVGGLALMRALEQQMPFANGVPNPYARGLRIGEHRGVRTVSHGGLWPGYKTEFLRAPALDAAVICISNHGGSDPGLLAHQVLDVLIEARGDAPTTPPLPPRVELAPLAGRWVDRDAGATLDIALAEDGAPVVTVGGVPLRPEVAADGRLATLRGTVQLALRRLDEGRIEVEQDAGHVSVWHRAAPDPVLPDGLAGAYASEEMAATWCFAATDDGRMDAVVEGPLLRGVRWAVEPVEGDLFRVWLPSLLFRGWLDVRATRDAAGRIDGLLVNSNRLKDVRYRRVG
jgi:D-aminopeptidase